MGLYDSEESVVHGFHEDFIPEEQLQAQWAEMIELKKLIHKTYLVKQRPLSILDIGIGTARVARHLSRLPDIWSKIHLYQGIDNAESCISLSEKLIQEEGISEKVKVKKWEARNLSELPGTFDLVITTWFTGGNFFDLSFPFENYEHTAALNLDSNPAFDAVFAPAFDKLEKGGYLVLGAVYKNNEPTRIKQENFYRKLGMTIITKPNESFTATREGFWSQRFTQERLFHYLRFAEVNQISIIDLDTYEYAMQVQVKK
jgi:SAM-dependent methyltransferase